MKATKAVWTAAAVAGLGLVAGSQPSAAEVGSLGRARDVNYETLEKGRDGVWSKSTVVVVGSPRAWDEAMAQMAADGTLLALPAPAAPDVNWGQQVVVLVTLGGQMHVGNDLEVTAARSRGRSLEVDVTLHLASGGLCGDPYAPYQVLAMDRAGAQNVQLSYAVQATQDYTGGEVSMPSLVEILDDAPVVATMTWGGVKGLYR